MSVHKRYAFKTERLVFRAIELNDEDVKLLHEFGSDGQTRAYSENSLWGPPTEQTMKNQATWYASNAILAVFICLPADSPDVRAEDRERWNPPSSKDSDVKTTAPKPVPIGYISLSHPGKGTNIHHRSTELGITVGEEYQAKGFGSEAINWAVDWAFQFAGLHCVRLWAVGMNVRAMKLYERLGFVVEGRWREHFYFDGAWQDQIWFSILEDEWRTLRQSKS